MPRQVDSLSSQSPEGDGSSRSEIDKSRIYADSLWPHEFECLWSDLNNKKDVLQVLSEARLVQYEAETDNGRSCVDHEWRWNGARVELMLLVTVLCLLTPEIEFRGKRFTRGRDLLYSILTRPRYGKEAQKDRILQFELAVKHQFISSRLNLRSV